MRAGQLVGRNEDNNMAEACTSCPVETKEDVIIYTWPENPYREEGVRIMIGIL